MFLENPRRSLGPPTSSGRSDPGWTRTTSLGTGSGALGQSQFIEEVGSVRPVSLGRGFVGLGI